MLMQDKLALGGPTWSAEMPAFCLRRTYLPVASPARRLQRQVHAAMAAPWAGLSIPASTDHLPGMVRMTISIAGAAFSWWFVLEILRVVI